MHRRDILIKTLVLTLENMEPINCMVAKVLGGSLASMPSNALVNEIDRRSMNTSAPARSSDFPEADKDVRNNDRPANAIDVTAVFNWWVAVIWLDTKFGKKKLINKHN